MHARKSCAPRLASAADGSARAPGPPVISKTPSVVPTPASSRHADDAHHPALLVVEDVAVEHPVAGVVGDKGNLDALARRDQHRVAPLPILGRPAVSRDHPETYRPRSAD